MSADNGIVSVWKLRLITARLAVPRRPPWTPVALFHRLYQVIARGQRPRRQERTRWQPPRKQERRARDCPSRAGPGNRTDLGRQRRSRHV